MLQLIVLIGLGTGLSHIVLVLFGAALVRWVLQTVYNCFAMTIAGFLRTMKEDKAGLGCV